MFGVNVKLNKTGQLSVYTLIPFKEIPDELLIFVSNNGAGVVFKLKRPRTTTLIFGTGKMVCTEARSERDAV